MSTGYTDFRNFPQPLLYYFQFTAYNTLSQETSVVIKLYDYPVVYYLLFNYWSASLFIIIVEGVKLRPSRI
jgi:hypothetical protein